MVLRYRWVTWGSKHEKTRGKQKWHHKHGNNFSNCLPGNSPISPLFDAFWEEFPFTTFKHWETSNIIKTSNKAETAKNNCAIWCPFVVAKMVGFPRKNRGTNIGRFFHWKFYPQTMALEGIFKVLLIDNAFTRLANAELRWGSLWRQKHSHDGSMEKWYIYPTWMVDFYGKRR